MGDSSYLNFSSPIGHLSGLDAKTITCKSTWLLFAGHRNPTVVSCTELRCRHLFSGWVVELQRNLRGGEGPPLPPQAPRRQNLKMNRVVLCILCPPPRVYTLYHPGWACPNVLVIFQQEGEGLPSWKESPCFRGQLQPGWVSQLTLSGVRGGP